MLPMKNGGELSAAHEPYHIAKEKAKEIDRIVKASERVLLKEA